METLQEQTVLPLVEIDWILVAILYELISLDHILLLRLVDGKLPLLSGKWLKLEVYRRTIQVQDVSLQGIPLVILVEICLRTHERKLGSFVCIRIIFLLVWVRICFLDPDLIVLLAARSCLKALILINILWWV